MDNTLKEAIELAIETGKLEDAREAAILACDHWSLDMREQGTDLKDAVTEARWAQGNGVGPAYMEVENLLTDCQDTLEQVAR